VKKEFQVATGGQRLDQFLVAQLDDVSRARVQQLIAQGLVEVDGIAAKRSHKLRGGERVTVTGEAQRPPLRAVAEDIPLTVVYEDDQLAVIDKPAGMMVHAGAGKSEGTLVNALLHRFQQLSAGGHPLRPGIVHRLDKETSGLILVAKDDVTHRKLQEQFAGRSVKKKYVALVHGWPKRESGTVDQPIGRDPVRRTRMTTKARAGRSAVSHYLVMRHIDSKFGKFALMEVKIETGRTHQIRVHLAALGHPVVGDRLYGAPARLKEGKKAPLTLTRNFLHAAELNFTHPRTGRTMSFRSRLPAELRKFMKKLGETELPDGI
jgi:23S rRNA pseudouridine1911/1915/1917 synthase